jgi:hypothetical protein
MRSWAPGGGGSEFPRGAPLAAGLSRGGAEAVASYRGALRLRPNDPETHIPLASLLLATGQLAEGWKELEWRWRTKHHEHMSADARGFKTPLWSRKAIGDRVILLHAGQGLGDTLQFCRYVPLIAAGARTVLEVQAPW